MAELDPVLQQATEALKAAHDAGDVESAKKLASYITNYSPNAVLNDTIEEPVSYSSQLGEFTDLIPDAVNSFSRCCQ